jgi:hypothetical protein
MRSRVDTARSSHPAIAHATPGIHTACDPARELIKETIMRLTLLAALGLVTSACMADVGGGDSSRGGRGSGSGSGSNDPGVEHITTPLTLRTWADFDKLPKGPWALDAKLTIQGRTITSLARLGDLSAVNELEISDSGVARIDSQNPIEIYGPLTITSNSKLTSLDNLVGEHLGTTTIDGNSVLTDIDALGPVDRLYGNLTITGNPVLETAALTSLLRVDGSVTVTDNAALTNLDFNKLATVNKVEVGNNLVLRTISGLPATDIHGDFILRGNRALTTIGTMSALYRITGSLTIDDNDALANLSAFPQALKWIDGALTISNNQNLTDIAQMRRLTGIGLAISITNNPNLSACRAYDVPDCVASTGTITIQNNRSANNCTTQCN